MADAQLNNPLDPYSTLLQNYGPPAVAPNVIPFRRPVQPTSPAVQPHEQPTLPNPPQAPQLSPLPTQAPAQQVTDGFKAMSPGLVLLAALGGALSGNPVASTVNSMAGFLKGIHEGDKEATDYHLKQYEANFDSALAANRQTVDQYNIDLSDYNQKRTAEAARNLMGTAQGRNDAIGIALLESGDLKGFSDHVAALDKLHATLPLQQIKLMQAIKGTKPVEVQVTQDGKTTTATATYGAAGWFDANTHEPIKGTVTPVATDPTSKLMDVAGIPAEQRPGVARQLLGLKTGPVGPDDPAVEAYSKTPNVQAIAHYQAPPGSTWGGNSPDAQFLRAAVFKANPDYNSNLYTTVGKTLTEFTTGTSGKRITALNVAIQHLDVLQSLANALQSGDVRAVNAAKQAWQKQFGEEAPTNFQAAVDIVGKEVVKAIVNAGGGVTEREEAKDSFSRIGSPQQVSGSIQTIERLMAGQLNGLRNQYESATSVAKGVIPFNNFLLPRTRQVLGSMAQSTNQTSQPRNFVNGQVYEDANGNRAMYKDGKWLPQ